MPLVVPNQAAAIAAAIAAGTMLAPPPLLSDSVPGVPGQGLIELWRSSTGLSLVDGKVSSWKGFNGTLAAQPDATKRPLGSAAGVAFSGAGDFLTTPIVADASAGYLVAKVKRAAGGSGSTSTFIAGGHQNATAPFQRLSLGFNSTDQATSWIGDSTPSNFSGSTTVAGGSTAVIGVGWDAGTGVLRLNGSQEKSRAFNAATNGVASGVGTRALWLGGINFFNGFASETADTLIALAVYSGSLTDAQRAAIDTAVAGL